MRSHGDRLGPGRAHAGHLRLPVGQGVAGLALSFLIENPQDNMTAGGILAPLVGTFFLVFISLMVAAPVGVLAGVYLNEYARDNWVTRIINLAVVNLAGVPSIVHALFGVGAFVFFAHMGRSLLAASCTLAVMTLPVIITSTREALASVPMAFREACWNLGASRWQTIRTLVLPNSISGILTGVILQVSRAAGETAPILFTGAVFFPVPDTAGRSSPTAGATAAWPVDAPVHADHPGPGVSGGRPVRHGRGAGRLVLVVNSLSIALRIYLRVAEEVVSRHGRLHIRFRRSVQLRRKPALPTSPGNSARSKSSASSGRPIRARRRC